MAEGHGFEHAMRLGGSHEVARTTQRTTALGALMLHQVTTARFGAQHLSCRGDLEPLRERLFGLNTFWTTHKFRFPSKGAQYREVPGVRQVVFSVVWVVWGRPAVSAAFGSHLQPVGLGKKHDVRRRRERFAIEGGQLYDSV